MRRSSKDSTKLSADSQRLVSISQAIVQAASRVEERTWERNLDQQLQKLLKTNHQDSIDAALNVLFKGELAVYDVLMDGVEAVSESSTMLEQGADGEVCWQALLVAAPVLAWTRFAIASGTIPNDVLATLGAHFSAHLLAEGAQAAVAPTLYSIDQLPRTHAETYALTHKLAQAAHKNNGGNGNKNGSGVKPAAPGPDTSQFLADTRYLLIAVVARKDAPLFRWQEAQHHLNFEAVREAALEQWRAQAGPNVTRLLPGCGVELLLPEAYYMACREADRQVRPVSIRAAVHYLTHTLNVEPSDLRAVVAGFGDEPGDSQVDEYRVGFTLRQSTDVVYGIVWPLYGQEDEDGAPAEGAPAGAGPLPPVEEIVGHLHEVGVSHVKRIGERYVAEYCDDCGAPLFADPSGELVHAEMPEDAPAGNEHFH
ncbi:DUF2863 family protein [Massilia forsythiae]|uniref:DUF2863 family protein n=1 Tax=Massilia forsythiae TaxID=2728020 RepID=A0A7Z2ZUM2_9BURK|nr:DUF2863 family protein [Massilia forsythiae]QJE01212.1 DUF2863 family protein [Massilia forsythiae]